MAYLMRAPQWKTIRDGILFFSGLTGVAILLWIWVKEGRSPNEALLLFFGAMLGLPAFIRADGKDKK